MPCPVCIFVTIICLSEDCGVKSHMRQIVTNIWSKLVWLNPDNLVFTNFPRSLNQFQKRCLSKYSNQDVLQCSVWKGGLDGRLRLNFFEQNLGIYQIDRLPRGRRWVCFHWCPSWSVQEVLETCGTLNSQSLPRKSPVINWRYFPRVVLEPVQASEVEVTQVQAFQHLQLKSWRKTLGRWTLVKQF